MKYEEYNIFTRAASAWRGCRTWPRPPARCGHWSPPAHPPAPGGRNHSPAQEIQGNDIQAGEDVYI